LDDLPNDFEFPIIEEEVDQKEETDQMEEIPEYQESNFDSASGLGNQYRIQENTSKA
jgi:hypothetical protein